jgi:DNA-binding transcriptional LysR family regulator
MRHIDIRLLQAAATVADELSFSRAAERLGITQPALTKQIQELEERLGVVLFERNNQGVALTEPCRIFVEEAKLALLHLDRAIHLTKASSKGAEAVLNLGTSPDIDPYLISTVLSVRLPLYPKLSVHASSNFSKELTRQVLSGELDVAVITEGVRTGRLNFVEISKYPLYALVRDQAPWTGQRSIALADLRDKAWIVFGRHVHPALYDEVLRRAHSLNIQPSEIHQVTTAEEAAHLVAQLDGVALLIRNGAWRVARDGLTLRPLAESDIRVKTAIITRADDRTRLTSEYVRASMRKLQQGGALVQQTLPL